MSSRRREGIPMILGRFKDENVYYFLFLLVLVLSLLPGAIWVQNEGVPLGSDYNYHLSLSGAWAGGENPLFREEYFLHGSPYPPAFHLLFALLSKAFFTSLLAVMNFFQIFLFPVVLCPFFYLVYKKTNLYTGVLGTCFLASSIAFHDRAGQVIPQALDALLFPLAVYLFMGNRRKLFAVLGAFLIYNHGIYAVFLVLSLLIYSLIYNKEKLQGFWLILILALPLFYVYSETTSSLLSPLSILSKVTSAQHVYFIMYPLFGIAYLGYFLAIFSLIGIFYFVKKQKTEFDRVLILWLIALIPIYPFLPDRFMGYAAQPLSAIGAIAVYEILKTPKARNLFLASSFVAAVAFTLVFMNNTKVIDWGWVKWLADLFFYSYRVL
jgi:hypothetical protein